MRTLRTTFFATIGVLVVVGSSMSFVRPVFAQAADPNNAVTAANTTKQNVVDTEVGNIYIEGAIVSLVSGINYMAQQLAYSLAVSLTSECPGQKVCWDSKPFKNALTQAWQGAIGESIGTLSEELDLGKYGLDLCNPDPRFLMQLQLGLLDELKPPDPKCDFNDIINNYESLGEEIGSGEFLNRFKATLSPGQAPVSVSLNILNGLYAERQTAEREAVVKKLSDAAAGGGFSGLSDVVSGRVTAPPEATRQQYQESVAAKEDGKHLSNTVIAGQIASRAYKTVAVNAAQTFAQTLIARLWNRFAQGLLSTQELVASQPDLVLNAEGLLNPGRADISQALAPRFTNIAAQPRDTGVVDMILLFSSCPEKGRQTMNCVMDSQFAQAVRQADFLEPLTVREALKKGMLHGDWKLVSSSTNPVVDSDPFCYTYAYCESNLKKLRAMRVLPVGWELAAAGASEKTTLAEVIAGFEDCSSGGKADDEHPWCHMIDPDWVLGIPPTQCKASVNGNFLLSPDIPNRLESCADVQSCLKKDDAGNCIGGFGYCTKEKRVWRFNGEQCPAQFASCKQFTGADGESIGLLSNTIDQGVCNASNAGCSEYSLSRTVTTQGVGGNPASKSDDWATTYAYFNGTIRKCDATNDGCLALVPLADASLNLIRNGGFEEIEGANGSLTVFHPTFWAPYSQPATDAHGFLSRGGGKSASGQNALLLDGTASTVLQDDITAPGGQTYTLSATLLPAAGKNVVAVFDLFFKDKSAAWVDLSASNFAFTTGFSGFSAAPSSTVVTSPTTAPGGSKNGLRVTFSGSVTGKSGRVWLTFASTRTDLQSMRLVALHAADSDNPTYLDEVQLEVGGSPTVFHEGYGAQPRAVHAKVAPEYLGCTGSIDDRPECDKFAPICSANEVGCESYVPTNGDAVVPGVVTAQDRCPAECAGYDTFKQVASTFEAEKFPEYFIPETAQVCSAADVGCSQFTDIENEQVSYYSSLRSCVGLDDATVGTYYSWEGSDTTGYQLKLWNLKDSAGVAQMDGVSDVCASATGCVDTVAPCTKLNGQNGACVSADKSQNALRRGGFCSRSDIDSGSFDCREFYDTAGNRHYRLLSRTIIASSSCRQYRITTSSAADCDASNGSWDANAARCTYFADLGQSSSCSAVANGCRAYKGNASTNIRTVFREDFENGTLDAALWSGAHRISSEAIVVGGHSVQVTNASLALKVKQTMKPGRAYSISFWARGSGTLDIPIAKSASAPANALVTLDPVTTWSVPLASEWRKYDLGPTFVIAPASGPAWGSFDVTLSFTKGAGEAYIDNIVLKEVQDTISVVRNSWKTPASCDQTSAGVTSPQEMLGCREYKTRLGGTEFLRSFSRICREKAIGCAAYASTAYTTTDPYVSTKLAVCKASAGTACDYTMPDGGGLQDVCTVPTGATECRFSLAGRTDATAGTYLDRVRLAGDSAMYLAIRAQDRCPAAQESCRVMGSPVRSYSASGNPTITEWKEGAYIYDAAKFDSLLCRFDEVSCKAFSSAGGTAYFKDPGTRTCEYRENVAVDTNGDGTNEGAVQDKSGWFIKDRESNIPCPGSLRQQGTLYRIARNGDDNYANWTGVCEAQYDQCEEFIDPQDTSAANPEGRPYYYLDNALLSSASCNGQASLDRGCVLFDQTSNPRKLYNPIATYESSRGTGGEPVAPSTASPKTANRLLQVRLDRECAEWLSCTSSEVVYDQERNEYRRRCTALAACQQSLGKTANFYECGETNQDVPVRLNGIKYSERGGEDKKVDWSDLEYSGYSVGGRYPAHSVVVYDLVEGGTCTLKPGERLCIGGGLFGGKSCGGSCTNDSDCNNSETCTYNEGVCSNDTSVSCATNAACGDGFCDKSYLATRRFGVQIDRSAECSSDDECNKDVRFSDVPKCFAGRCIYDYTGGKFNAQPIQCRAYPETDSPYGPGAVNADAPGVSNGGYDGGGQPIAKKQDFSGANVCVKGQTCECSYKRINYGTSNDRFVGLSGSYASGLCSGGPNDGLPCDPNQADTTDSPSYCQPTKGGTCKRPKSVSVLNGWMGVCLDSDRSRTVGGVADRFACNLWLPVDQLAGAPDISNLHTEAGFVMNSDLLYCAVAKGNQAVDGQSYSRALSMQRTNDGDTPKSESYSTNLLFTQDQTKTNTELYHPSETIYKRDISYLRIDAESSIGNNSNDFNEMRYPVFYLLPDKWMNYQSYGDSCVAGDAINDNTICGGNYYKSGSTSGNNCTEVDGHYYFCFDVVWNSDSSMNYIRLKSHHKEGDGEGPLMRFNVVGIFRDYCTDVAQTTDISSGSETDAQSVAWTDRLYRGYSDSGYDFNHQTNRPNVLASQKPFGVIAQASSISSDSVTFSKGAGSSNGDWPLGLWGSEGGTNSAGAYLDCDEDGACQVRTDGGTTASGTPYACTGGCALSGAGLNDSWDFEGANAARNAGSRLSQLFAVIFKTYDWSSGGVYKVNDSSADDYRAEHVTKATAPKVRGVKAARCAATAEGLCEEEASEGLTVNDVSSGDITAETTGEFVVSLKYYAFADKDRMPIRRRQVDFGDDEPITNSPGWYKNHRGCKAGSSSCSTSNDYCGDRDEWGLTLESCEPQYFQESHTYFCSQDDVTGSGRLPACSGGGTFPCTDGTYCVFKPRVQVTDNWGVCNGSCPGGDDGSDACMNESFSNILSAPNSYDGCFLLNNRNFFPRGSNNQLNRPWTEYAGVIKLLPPQE